MSVALTKKGYFMGTTTWTDEDVKTIRKTMDCNIPEIMELIPTKSYNAIVQKRTRIKNNIDYSGNGTQQRIRVDGGDGISPLVKEILESCTYSYACKHRDRGYL
jgi:hypothetical protein